MRIFRAQYRDRGGKTRKSGKWYLDFVDHIGVRHRMPGLENKRRTEDLGRNIEDLVSCKVSGQQPDVVLQKWIEGLPSRLLKKLIEWDLVGAHRAAAVQGLKLHLEDFKQHLTSKGLTKDHIDKSYSRTKKVFEGCGFKSWSDISGSKLQRYIRSLTDDMSAKTANYYLREVKSFCRWMVQDRRASESPIAYLKPMEAVQTYTRAALSPDEIGRLLSHTEASGRAYCMTGRQRATLYRIALETGLRAGELRSLKVSSFDLHNRMVSLSGQHTKNKKAATLPLRIETVKLLKVQFAGKLPDAKAFRLPARGRMSNMLKDDLAAARKKWLDEVLTDPVALADREKSDFLSDDKDGGKIDFHSLRTSFATLLAEAGVNPKTAMQLMRHSDINLTMKTYSRSYRESEVSAIDNLPSFDCPDTQAEKRTGTDDMSAVPAAAADRTHDSKEGENRLAICLATPDTFNQSQPDLTRDEAGRRSFCESAVEGLKTVFSGGNLRLPEVGLEPTPCCQDGILNPARLPIPPLRLR